MNGHIQYLADEVAENHRDGLLSRREAMRRLAYLGFSAVGASALLAACGGDDKEDAASQAPTTAQSGGPTSTGPVTPAAGGPTTTGRPLATQDITYAGKGHQVLGVLAPAASPRGGVLVIHENRGISDFVKSMVGRLAASGYTAIGVDLLSPQGGTAKLPDPAELQSVLGQNAQAGMAVDDMKSTLEELARRVPGKKLGATGFCFGGNMTWDLIAAGEPPALAAAVPFYGSPINPVFTKSKAAVLAMYAGQDTRVNASQQQARLGLEQAKLTFDMKTYPDVPHAFMRSIDDPNSGNGFTQASAAYAAMLEWFGRHLG